MSRLHPKKNIVALIEAWQTVQEAFPDAQLWIAGDGSDEYVQTLHDVVKTHNLGDTISFLGFVRGEDKRRVLRKAWGLALPSHQENFGVVVLEAIAAGLPVVISGEVQLRSFVEDHELGIVVDRTDPKSIAEGIISMLKNDSWRQSITEKGPAAIENTFSVERIGAQLREMYEQACRRSRSNVAA